MEGKNSIIKSVYCRIGKDLIAVHVQLDKLYRICDIDCSKTTREIILSEFRGRQGNSSSIMQELENALNNIMNL